MWCPCSFSAGALVVVHYGIINARTAMTAIAIALSAVATLEPQAIEEANRYFAVSGSRKWGRARIRPHHRSRQLACQFTSLILV